jgi:hypothetical protein
LSICVHVIPDSLVCKTRTWDEINTSFVACGLRQQRKQINMMFVDPCIIVYFTLKIPTRCNSVSKFNFIFIWSSTCFGGHTAHHQELKTALAASGFAYVEGCLTCSCWMLSSNYTANNPDGHLLRVTIPYAVLIQFDLLRMSKI